MRGRRRRALGRLGLGPFGRIGAAAALEAGARLVRRHPRAALDAAAAGLTAAARSGLGELTAWLDPAPRDRRGWGRVRGLDRAERRRLRAYLDAAARSERAEDDVASR